ncbi:hypothetical protein ABPG75_005703 [Micractinium tetrahymenae]
MTRGRMLAALVGAALLLSTAAAAGGTTGAATVDQLAMALLPTFSVQSISDSPPPAPETKLPAFCALLLTETPDACMIAGPTGDFARALCTACGAVVPTTEHRSLLQTPPAPLQPCSQVTDTSTMCGFFKEQAGDDACSAMGFLTIFMTSNCAATCKRCTPDAPGAASPSPSPAGPQRPACATAPDASACAFFFASLANPCSLEGAGDPLIANFTRTSCQTSCGICLEPASPAPAEEQPAQPSPAEEQPSPATPAEPQPSPVEEQPSPATPAEPQPSPDEQVSPSAPNGEPAPEPQPAQPSPTTEPQPSPTTPAEPSPATPVEPQPSPSAPAEPSPAESPVGAQPAPGADCVDLSTPTFSCADVLKQDLCDSTWAAAWCPASCGYCEPGTASPPAEQPTELQPSPVQEVSPSAPSGEPAPEQQPEPSPAASPVTEPQPSPASPAEPSPVVPASPADGVDVPAQPSPPSDVTLPTPEAGPSPSPAEPQPSPVQELSPSAPTGEPAPEPQPAQPAPSAEPQPSPTTPAEPQPSPSQPQPAEPSPVASSEPQPSPVEPLSPSAPTGEPAPEPAQPSPSAEPQPSPVTPAGPSPSQPQPAEASPAEPQPSPLTPACPTTLSYEQGFSAGYAAGMAAARAAATAEESTGPTYSSGRRLLAANAAPAELTAAAGQVLAAQGTESAALALPSGFFAGMVVAGAVCALLAGAALLASSRRQAAALPL